MLDLDHKSKTLAIARRLVEQLDKGKLEAIEGERWLLLQLEPRQDRGWDLLAHIRDCTARADFLPLVKELGELLDEVDWDVLDELVPALEQKVAAQDARIRGYGDALAKARVYLNTLRRDLTLARNDGVPLIEDERFLLILDGLVISLDRAIQEQNFLTVPGLIEEVEKKGQPAHLETDKIEERVKGKKHFARQADLLLLRPPLSDRRGVEEYEYTVLLRTPSRPGSHGVNVQGTSTVVKADRDRVIEDFRKVTVALNYATRRKADIGTSGADAAEPVAAGATRDLHLGAPGSQHGVPVVNPNLQLREVGDFMFRIFIPEQIAQFLRAQPCSLTLTTNDLEVPWELMLTDSGLMEGGFVCTERPVARLPMGYVIPRLDFFDAPPPKKKRFLFIYSDPDENLVGARHEVRAIETALKDRWKNDVEVEVIERTEATGERMNEVLRGNRFDVIHYAGHAAFNVEKPELSALLLSGHEPLYAQKIRRLLKGRPLVVLNACQSAATASGQQAPETRYELQQPEGLAAAFIYGGALGCLGAIWPVFDGPAAEFAVAFYNKVIEGEMIGEAGRHARIEVQKAHTDGITWASFTLYGDPTFRVFS
ncbi:CHAT domain-containing protein [Boseaceae bacterium BT-24-1]|nr:CHAT domain-containing protein [Boseaceae bacterium BT-24-1]